MAGAFGVLAAPVGEARTHAQFGHERVGGPHAAAVPGCECGAVALHLRAGTGSVQGDVALVDLGAGDPGVVEEDLPLRRKAPRQIEFHAGRVARPGQQFLYRGHIGVGVALVELLAVEGRNAEQRAFFEQLELGANLDVAALFGRCLGRAAGVVVQVDAELVGVARCVVRGAIRDVVAAQFVGLVEGADARAPQAFGLLIGERAGSAAVGRLELVVAQSADELDGRVQRQGVLQVQPQVLGLEGVEGHGCAAIGHAVAIVGCAHRGAGACRGVGVAGVAQGIVVVEVDAGDDVVLFAAPDERVRVVALQLGQRAFANAALGAACECGTVMDLVQCGGAGRGKADGAGEQVALVRAVAQARLQLAAIAKTVDMAQRQVLRRGVQIVAVQTIVVAGGQRGHDLAVVADPGMVVVGAAFDIQRIQADGKLVACADAPGKGGCNAAFVLAGAVVVGVVHHGVEAQCGVLAGLEVEVTGEAVFLAGAQGVRDFVLVDQQRRLVDLVDHAAGRALAKQHGGRALEHFDAVEVERIAFVQGGILHAIGVDVARLA